MATQQSRTPGRQSHWANAIGPTTQRRPHRQDTSQRTHGQACSLAGWHHAVYPRACGERIRASRTCADGGGLSPRLRGTVPGPQPRARRPRFIPAPAGNGPHWPPCRNTATVYPRACGERARLPLALAFFGGLSPRLRGTGAACCTAMTPRRFIPAPAGNGATSYSRRDSWAVYPRACGERVSRTGRIRTAPVYPRACGERRSAHAPSGGFCGLSPRLRGTADDAGHAFAPQPVYPRACGERSCVRSMIGGRTGLSPRLRGTVDEDTDMETIKRFIPAPAGNGGADTAAPRRRPVYPRACGERQIGIG